MEAFDVHDNDSSTDEDVPCEKEQVLPPIQPKVSNMVVSAKFDIKKATGLSKLNFAMLAHILPNTVYNPKECTTLRFNVTVLHHKTLGGILHSNGNANLCGAHTLLQGREGMKKFGKQLAVALGVGQITICNFRVTNVVATMKLPYSINVLAFKDKHRANAKISDARPSVKYKCEEPRFTAMIFTAGKVNLLGCRSVEELPAVSAKVLELTEGCQASGL